MSSEKRETLLTELTNKLRQSSSLSIVMSQCGAECLGINATDLNCLNILGLRGAITPSELAAATGLTTASITGAVDRLEAAGFVRRERDSHDRRKVLVQIVTGDAKTQVRDVFQPVVSAWRQANDDFSDAELAVIIEHYRRVEEMTRALLDSFKGCQGEGEPAKFAAEG